MGAPIGSRSTPPAYKPLPPIPTKQAATPKQLPRPTAPSVIVDFELMNNRSFDSKVPETVNTTTFSVTEKDTSSVAHYILLPDDTIKTKVNATIFETAILEVVSEKSIRDPKVHNSNKLAYILCDGNHRMLVCDASQLEKFRRVSFFALNINGTGTIFSLKSNLADNYGISLAGRDDGEIPVQFKKAIEIYKRTLGP